MISIRSLVSLSVYAVPGSLLQQTNVPNLRLKYRHDTLVEELRMVCADWSFEQGDAAPVHPTGESIAAKAMSVTFARS